MGWLDHKHYWRPKTALNTVVDPQTKGNIGGLIIEDCMCGAVRQIEFWPGKSPVIRTTLATEDKP